MENNKLKQTDENKRGFSYEAAKRILPTLESLVDISKREGYRIGEMRSPYVNSRDYVTIREFPPHKPLTEEQVRRLNMEISAMHIACID